MYAIVFYSETLLQLIAGTTYLKPSYLTSHSTFDIISTFDIKSYVQDVLTHPIKETIVRTIL